MSEKMRKSETGERKTPNNVMIPLDPFLSLRIRELGLTTDISSPFWRMTSRDNLNPGENYSRDTSRATAALFAAGFGCQPRTDKNGETTSYFSHMLDPLSELLSESPDTPLLAHTFAFPGTEWDADMRRRHPKADICSIKNHPAVMSNAIDAWVRDLREMLPKNIKHLDGLIISHSFAGRALATIFSEIIGEKGDGKEKILRYLQSLAQRNGFESISLSPVFLSPAFGINKDVARIAPLADPLRWVDGKMKELPAKWENIYKRYLDMTKIPFGVVTDVVTGHDKLAKGLIGQDNTGFMDGFSANDPHVLLQHAQELHRRKFPPTGILCEILRDAQGIHPLVITGRHDRLADNSITNHVFGQPNTGNEESYHFQTNLTHLECCEDPTLIAQLIADTVTRTMGYKHET